MILAKMKFPNNITSNLSKQVLKKKDTLQKCSTPTLLSNKKNPRRLKY